MLRMKLGVGWGGVGMITFFALAHMVGATQHHVSCTCTHGRCYATPWGGLGWGGVGMITFFSLAHMVGATQHHVSCTCTHGRCYATPWGGLGWGGVGWGCTHSFHLHTWLVLRNTMGWVGVGWGGDDNILFTCTHGWCYATSCFLHLHTWSVLRNTMGWVGVGWGGVGMITFFSLAHMVGATQHHVSCTCTHGRCYATPWGGVGVGWGW